MIKSMALDMFGTVLCGMRLVKFRARKATKVKREIKVIPVPWEQLEQKEIKVMRVLLAHRVLKDLKVYKGQKGIKAILDQLVCKALKVCKV